MPVMRLYSVGYLLLVLSLLMGMPRHEPRESHESPGRRLGPRLVAQRGEDRVPNGRRRRRDLRHECGRLGRHAAGKLSAGRRRAGLVTRRCQHRVLARRLESGVWPNLRDHGHER
jgi:hypothetical protein